MIQTNNTVQDLTTTSGITVNTVAVTSGFSAVGDGGGGNFIWKTIAVYGSRPTEDGGIIVYSTADTSGWWERQFEFIDIRFFGGKADVQAFSDASITSREAALTSANPHFSANDIGKTIYVSGAGITPSLPVGAPAQTLIATIIAFNSATQVTLSVAASTTVTNAPFTYGTDSTSAFTKINNYGRSLTNKSLQIVLQSGTYMTSVNNWLAGIRSVEVIGNGANIICTRNTSDTNFANRQALNMPSVFDSFDNAFSNDNKIYGDLIQSTVVKERATDDPLPSGATSVTTITPGAAASYKPGTWAIVWGFEHENVPGFPPDPRYYDYVKVVTADETTGVITFDRALNYQYDSRWPDNPPYVTPLNMPSGGVGGAPRIISCSRDRITEIKKVNNTVDPPDIKSVNITDKFTIVEDLVMRDINFVPFNCWLDTSTPLRNGRISVYGYINAKFINVTCTSVYPGQGKNLLFDKCQFTQACEPDKLIDQLQFKDTSFVDVVNGGGVNFLQMYGCTFAGRFNISPRYLDMDNCTFASTAFGSTQALAFIGQNKGVEHVRLGTNVWNCSLPSRSALIANSNNTILTVDKLLDPGDNIFDPTFTFVLVLKNKWIDARNGRQVLPGSIGYTDTVINKRLIVKNVYDMASYYSVQTDDEMLKAKYAALKAKYKDYVGVVGDFSVKPNDPTTDPPDVFKFIYVRRISVEGRQHKVGAYANNYQLFLREDLFPQIQYRENTPGHDLKRILLTEQDIAVGGAVNIRSVFGYPCRLMVNVIKAYKDIEHPENNISAVLKLVSYPTGSFTQTINLKTIGIRVVEIGRNSGTQDGDVLSNIDDPSLMSCLGFSWSITPADTAPHHLPIVQIYLEAFELIR